MTRLNKNMRTAFVLCFIGVPLSSTRSLAKSEPPVLPTPQFYQFLEGELTLPKGPVEVRFVLPTQVEPSIRIAMELILKGLKEAGVEPKVTELKAGQLSGKNGFNVILLPFSELLAPHQRSILSSEDRSLLTRKDSTGQEYVLVTKPQEKAAYLVGQTSQGVLYAAASLLQLMTGANDRYGFPQSISAISPTSSTGWLPTGCQMSRLIAGSTIGATESRLMLLESSGSWTSVRATKSTWSWPMDSVGGPNSFRASLR